MSFSSRDRCPIINLSIFANLQPRLCSVMQRRYRLDLDLDLDLDLSLGPACSLLCRCGGFGPPGGGGEDGLRAPPTSGPLLAEGCPAPLVGWRESGRGDGAERARPCSASSGDDGRAQATTSPLLPRRASSEFDVSLAV